MQRGRKDDEVPKPVVVLLVPVRRQLETKDPGIPLLDYDHHRLPPVAVAEALGLTCAICIQVRLVIVMNVYNEQKAVDRFRGLLQLGYVIESLHTWRRRPSTALRAVLWQIRGLFERRNGNRPSRRRWRELNRRPCQDRYWGRV